MPELTPEDRQRIYAEEKARLEAQEQLKTEKASKDLASAGIGCLILIVVGGLAFALWPRQKPWEAKPRPERGAVIAIKPGYPPLCMDTKEGLDEATKWYGVDRGEVLRAMLKHGGEILAPGARIKLLDPGILRARVRVLESERECWVVQELVR